MFQMVVTVLYMCIMSSVLLRLLKSVCLIDFFCLLVLLIAEMSILKYCTVITDLPILVILSTLLYIL